VDHAKEKALPPEFDYAKQALLYLPKKMPDVRDAGFAGKARTKLRSCSK